MSTPRQKIDVTKNKNVELDPKMEEIESNSKKDVRVGCRENFNEYLLTSTLHGLRYVGDRTISYLERIFFACIFFLVLIMSVYLISIVWRKWSHSPIEVTLNSKSTSVRDIPFPAVTICDMNVVSKAAVRKNIPRGSADYAVIRALCRGEISVEDDSKNNTDSSWFGFLRVLLKVTKSIDETFVLCRFGGQEYNCSDIFTALLTDAGVCYRFNGIDRNFFFDLNSVTAEEKQKMWTVERSYSKQSEENSKRFPRPAIGPGNEQGLNLIMKADVADYFCSSTESYGFKVLIHNPNDLPNVAYLGTAIPSNYESRLAVTPHLSIGARSIKNLPIDVRGCIFDSENFLTYFSTYSESNCISECETKLLYKSCGCIKYFQPMQNPNITICGGAPNITKCVENVDHQIMMRQNPSFNCSYCLPGCFALNYKVSFSMARIYDRLTFLTERNLKSRDLAMLHVYYTQATFRAQKKEELVDFSEFLANLGGLLGLFLGFSGLSVIEILYFMSIRPYCQFLRLSNARRELMKKLTRKLGEIRQNRRSPVIWPIHPNLSFDETYHQRHLN